jgi:uncharacterized damage-inducible protein DinB
MDRQFRAQLDDMQMQRESIFKELRELPDQVLLEADEESKRTVRQLISLYCNHERNHIVQVEKTRRLINAYPSEIQLLLSQADQSRGDLIASLQGLSDNQWEQKPGENVWSIQEILTHLMDVESRLLQRILTIVHKK